MEPGINKKYNGGEKRCAGSQGRFEEEKGEGGTASSLDSQKQLEREKRQAGQASLLIENTRRSMLALTKVLWRAYHPQRRMSGVENRGEKGGREYKLPTLMTAADCQVTKKKVTKRSTLRKKFSNKESSEGRMSRTHL